MVAAEFTIPSQKFPAVNEENYEKPQSGWSLSQPKSNRATPEHGVVTILSK
jgi:hypothetical protein